LNTMVRLGAGTEVYIAVGQGSGVPRYLQWPQFAVVRLSD
jgi:hypothetical protein